MTLYSDADVVMRLSKPNVAHWRKSRGGVDFDLVRRWGTNMQRVTDETKIRDAKNQAKREKEGR